jgi:hypothetical protein
MYYSSYAEARRRLKNIKSPCCKLLKNLNKIKYQASTIGPSVVVKRSPNFWAKAQCEEQSFPNKHSDSVLSTTLLQEKGAVLQNKDQF